MSTNRAELNRLAQAWSEQWPAALALWSRFTRLSSPRLCTAHSQAAAEGLTASFAMIRLTDQGVIIDLTEVYAKKLGEYALEILAHEIGHHVYAPADLSDHARLLARMRAALPTREQDAPLIANLYTDLLINDRLQRSAELRMAEVYQHLACDPDDRLWLLYMRIYEQLWRLRKGALAIGMVDDRMEGDAYLGARLVRAYARDWLDGAGGFAVLCLPYLLEMKRPSKDSAGGWQDTRAAGQGAGEIPEGLTSIDPAEKTSPIHPALDPRVNGGKEQPPSKDSQASSPTGQNRQPFEFGEILRAMGINMDDHEIAVRYYRERALPHLVRFPVRSAPESSEPLPESLEPWDPGSPIEDIDWIESVIASPHIIPALTTLQRVWGTAEGSQPAKEPVDLDLYVDSSGSMPNPQSQISYLTLAGAIIVLSALRAGARVQATLWSGPQQFLTTAGFVRDEKQILRVLTGFFGGSTAFPIHILRDTFAAPPTRPAHILIISDEGVDTLFDKDERGGSGRDIARAALQAAAGGGSMVLNLYYPPEKYPALVDAAGMGWTIFRITGWEELETFAREFSRKNYSPAPPGPDHRSPRRSP